MDEESECACNENYRRGFGLKISHLGYYGGPDKRQGDSASF